jgi:hypothetical protein
MEFNMLVSFQTSVKIMKHVRRFQNLLSLEHHKRTLTSDRMIARHFVEGISPVEWKKIS